jgi:hypothetical protein
MKSIIGPVVIAALLAIAGAAFTAAGNTERRLADVHQQIATLQYSTALADDDEGATVRMARRIPRVGDEMASDMRAERATAEYWTSDYSTLEPKRDASGSLTETDPQLALVSANAEFRGAQHAADRNELLRRLDRSVKTYADVLKSNPSADTAYNYEYVVRLRDTTQKAKPTSKADPKLAAKVAANTTSDLPAGPTLHGVPGAPPKGTDMSQFKIVIPKRGEERKDNPEAGKGGTKVRKG